jgi:uncharacterized protein YacL
MTLLYVIFFFAGAFVGAASCFQILLSIEIKLHIAVIVLCHTAAAILCGGILSLSALPIRTAFHGFANFLRRRFKGIRVVDIAGVMLGVVVGLVFSFLTEFLFRLFLHIVGVRILIDVIIGLSAAFLTGISVSGWLAAEKNKRDGNDVSQDSQGQFKGYKGYLLTESALRNPKTPDICRRWIDGNIYVLASTVKNLREQNSGEAEVLTAYAAFQSLFNARVVKILEFDTSAGALEVYLEAAKSKKLKIIAAGDEAKELKKSVFAVILAVE